MLVHRTWWLNHADTIRAAGLNVTVGFSNEMVNALQLSHPKIFYLYS